MTILVNGTLKPKLQKADVECQSTAEAGVS
jgi:hypothetical protein